MNTSNQNIIKWVVISSSVILMTVSIYLLYINFKSLKIQRIVKQETMTGKLKSKSDYIAKVYPKFPNITVVEEPVAVQISRYLINEKKYEEARKILEADQSNPYDGRKEYFIATTFYNEKQYDSAIYYAKLCQDIKPKFYNNLTIMASSYERTGQNDKSIALWEEFLTHTKNKRDPWRIVASLYNNKGNIKKAEQYIDSAKVYHPKDSIIDQLYKKIKAKAAIGEHQNIYNEALKYYRAKNFKKAVNSFNEFIKLSPNYPNAYELRAFSNYHIKAYHNSIEDITKLETFKDYKIKPNVLNLQGVNHFLLKQQDKACEYFTRAKNLGDKDGISNYNKFCKKK